MDVLGMIKRGELTFVVGTRNGLAIKPQKETRDEILHLAELGAVAKNITILCPTNGKYIADFCEHNKACINVDFCKMRNGVES